MIIDNETQFQAGAICNTNKRKSHRTKSYRCDKNERTNEKKMKKKQQKQHLTDTTEQTHSQAAKKPQISEIYCVSTVCESLLEFFVVALVNQTLGVCLIKSEC